MSPVSSGPDMPQNSRSSFPDFLRTMSVKLSVKDVEISNQSTLGMRLERFGEVRIVDETNGCGLDFVLWILEHHPRRGSSTLKKNGFGTCISIEGEKMRKTRGLWRGNRAFEMHA